ncbi:MAG TPA: cob(I)yrinic acid a,c-diamide adenosyltransferase [Candidatus Thermoplasmatota archaeon]|nr:cob(I)yrinic acid a,c-diamide adenosyltransferase [Candidatus Thermoplasmatota archaeon]
MSRISTGTGDRGTTGLADGSRLAKTDPLFEAVGAVDEANDLLGVAAAIADPDTRATLQAFQRDLFTLGADLASPESMRGAMRVTEEAVRRVEATTDRLEASLPPLTRFILPGGTPLAAHLQHARSVVRRAERLVWGLAARVKVNPEVLVYLNRLSDCLFLLARQANRKAGVPEPEWEGKAR